MKMKLKLLFHCLDILLWEGEWNSMEPSIIMFHPILNNEPSIIPFHMNAEEKNVHFLNFVELYLLSFKIMHFVIWFYLVVQKMKQDRRKFTYCMWKSE